MSMALLLPNALDGVMNPWIASFPVKYIVSVASDLVILVLPIPSSDFGPPCPDNVLLICPLPANPASCLSKSPGRADVRPAKTSPESGRSEFRGLNPYSILRRDNLLLSVSLKSGRYRRSL